MQIELNHLEDTQNLAKEMATLINEPAIICLKGNLGSGKTSFARYFIHAKLGNEVEVTSPTFNLIHTYNATPPIWHIDLYRLNNQEELWEIGIEEVLYGHIALIEWPELLYNFLPKDYILMQFSLLNENKRVCEIRPYGKWQPKF